MWPGAALGAKALAGGQHKGDSCKSPMLLRTKVLNVLDKPCQSQSVLKQQPRAQDKACFGAACFLLLALYHLCTAIL